MVSVMFIISWRFVSIFSCLLICFRMWSTVICLLQVSQISGSSHSKMGCGLGLCDLPSTSIFFYWWVGIFVYFSLFLVIYFSIRKASYFLFCYDSCFYVTSEMGSLIHFVVRLWMSFITLMQSVYNNNYYLFQFETNMDV